MVDAVEATRSAAGLAGSGDRPPGSDCPKAMVHGPCGGVRSDGGCEVDARPCPFVGRQVLRPPPADRRLPRTPTVDRFVVDLRLPDDSATLASVVDILRSIGATALIGEHVDDPAGTTPSGCARRLADAGLPAIVTLTGRHRSPDQHQAEIDAVVDAGVVAVHCVTGDHPSVRFGPDASAAFTLDGTQLAARARASGAIVSVGESPAAPPVDGRPDRVVLKQDAGADIAVLNHAGSPSDLISFADRCVGAGADLSLVAPVPVITDRASARTLDRFPGLILPDGLVDRILSARDPVETGVAAAAELADELLASDRFVAVNLSGSACSSGPVDRAEIMATVARSVT